MFGGGVLLCSRDSRLFFMSRPHLAPVPRLTPEISLSETQMGGTRLLQRSHAQRGSQVPAQQRHRRAGLQGAWAPVWRVGWSDEAGVREGWGPR